MKKLNIITASFVLMFVAFISMPTPVLADEECKNPGPYGVCIPDTDITIGDVTITDEQILLFGATYLAGAAFIANAQIIRKRVA